MPHLPWAPFLPHLVPGCGDKLTVMLSEWTATLSRTHRAVIPPSPGAVVEGLPSLREQDPKPFSLLLDLGIETEGFG